MVGPLVRDDSIAERRRERLRAAKLQVAANRVTERVVSLDMFLNLVTIAQK